MSEQPPEITASSTEIEDLDPGPMLNPELAESLHALLYGKEGPSDQLEEELVRLAAVHQDVVYAELIWMLSHLRFTRQEAKQHWERIVAHRNEMSERQGAPVDLRVALVSYFIEVEHKLENPKVIELRVFEQTQASAYRDALTGLCNYRLLREHLSRELSRAQRYGTPLSLVMVDIDDFKHYNDWNGHEAGNQVLASIARVLAGSLRRSDIAARYGGEEFALLLPSTPKTDAELVAERARAEIEAHVFPHGETQPGGALTVSMGVATYPADGGRPSELVQRADRAMYAAKARGKNQVSLFGEDRRSYRRVRAELNGEFCVLAPDYHAITTVDVSEQGLLFVVDHELTLGSVIDVRLLLPGQDREIMTTGRVVRVEEIRPGKYEAAVRMLEISRQDRMQLSSYLQQSGSAADAEAEDPE